MERATTQRVRQFEDLGFTAFAAERFEIAERCFRMVVVARPERGDAWIGLGSALGKQGRHDEAALIFALADAMGVTGDGWPCLLAAESLLRAGRTEEATEALDRFEAERAGGAGEAEHAAARALGARLGVPS